MQLVGSLIFLCNTTSENVVAQFNNKVRETHWKVVSHVLKCIVCTLNHGILDMLTIDELSWYCDSASGRD